MLIDIEHVAKLARIELSSAEKERFHDDLEKILEHFTELQKLNTDNVVPMTGGTQLKDVFREDDAPFQADSENVAKAFPDKKGNYLKVPGVFNDSDLDK